MPISNLLLHLALRWPEEPHAVGCWQRELGARLCLWGLVVVTPQGVHGTVAGPPDDLDAYVRAARAHPGLARASFWRGTSRVPHLPRLTVMMREQGRASRSGHELLVAEDVAPAEEARCPGGPGVLEERVRTATGPRTPLPTGCELCGAPAYAHRACVAPLCRSGAGLCNACADFALCRAHRN